MADQDHDAIKRQQDEAIKKRMEEAKKRLADEKAAREKQQAEQREATAGVKPTPTQEENDLAATGVQVELEPDGSPPDPSVQKTRDLKPAPSSGGGYQTRTTAPAAKHE